MSGVKVLKKGDYLFKEGEKIQSVWVIQSGQISVCIQKNKKNVEVMSVAAGYVFADLVVQGVLTYNFSALAMNEVKVAEIPLENFKQQFEALHQINKTFVKSMAEKLKWSMTELKSVKFEKDPAPCSDENIPQVFGAIFHVLNHKGLKEGISSKVDWTTLKQYSQRVFGESPKRVENASQVLVKLKLAEYIMGKNPEEPEGKDEIHGFSIKDLTALESFFEFYQYYYYKGGKSEFLKFDETIYNTLRLLTMAYNGIEADRFGIVSKDFGEVTDFFKDYGVILGAGHFTALESKGLFCKRKPVANNKVHLQFEFKEFKTQQDIWRIIREIDKWNEKGFVDIADAEDMPKKKKTIEGVECDDCHAVMILHSKFCSECGAKLVSLDKKAA
ncbi:MAG: cyclic nucleotide-binding domain-containing protein [Pseudobdellovibrio sp.]